MTNPNGTVLGGNLSPNATTIPGVGNVVADIGGNTWLLFGEVSGSLGLQLGIVVTAPMAPGTTMAVQVSGEIPYALFNIGSGGACPVVCGNIPARATSAGGQCIGTCDTSGAITVHDCRIGTPNTAGAAMVGLLAGQPINTQAPLVGQAYIWDGTRWTATGIASGYCGLKMTGNPTATTMTTMSVGVPVTAGWVGDGQSLNASTVAGSGQLVAGAAGVYDIVCSASYRSASNSGDLIDATLVVNGSIKGQAEFEPATTDFGNFTVKCRMNVSAAQVGGASAIVALYLTNQTSSGHTIEITNATFTMTRIG